MLMEPISCYREWNSSTEVTDKATDAFTCTRTEYMHRVQSSRKETKHWLFIWRKIVYGTLEKVTALKMEAEYSSEAALKFYKDTWRHVTED